MKHRDTQGENGHVITEVDIGVMHLQGKVHQGFTITPEGRKEASNRLSLRSSGRNQHCPLEPQGGTSTVGNLILTSSPQNGESINFSCFKPPHFVAICYRSHGELIYHSSSDLFCIFCTRLQTPQSGTTSLIHLDNFSTRQRAWQRWVFVKYLLKE